jgi:hypothetical protein
MEKRIFSLILAVFFTMALVPASYGVESYIPSNGQIAVNLWEKGLFLGSNGTFNLDKPLLRTEAAVMVVRLLGKEAEVKSGDYSQPFDDVPAWASPYVGYCYENGILKGISKTKYGSSTAITAAQFTTLILRVLGYKDPDDFTVDTAVQKARDIYLLNMDDTVYKTRYSPTGRFLRDDVVFVAYCALQQNMKDSYKTLEDTIELPGRPEGEVPTLTASGIKAPEASCDSSGGSDASTDTKPSSPDSSSEGSGKQSAKAPAGKITVDYEYAESGMLFSATFYVDGKEVASYYDGGKLSGTLFVYGDGWHLAADLKWVTKFIPAPLPGYPSSSNSKAIKTPTTIKINSSDKVYTVSSGSWKDDEFIVKNNLEPVISFIIREFENEAQRLRGAGYE